MVNQYLNYLLWIKKFFYTVHKCDSVIKLGQVSTLRVKVAMKTEL